MADPTAPAAGERVPVLRDLALIADGERGGLIAPDGNLVWLCAPRWHDEAVMSALIGGGGRYSVTPAEPYTWGGSYEDGTLIWRSRWITNTSVIESRDALAAPADVHRAVIVRQIRAGARPAQVRVTLDVTGGFGRRSMRNPRRDDHGRWTARTGNLRVRWTGASDARLDEAGQLLLDVVLPADQAHDLVLEISDQALPGPPEPAALWSATEAHWQGSVPDMAATIGPRDARLAGAVLRGLTSGSGGMVAAATMSLPERARRSRSYDYRYAWIRDQCYAGLAAAAAGMGDLLETAARFVTARVLTDGDALRPAYLVDGGPVPDEHAVSVPGYPGGADIAGNWANDQFQLDALGEVLQLLAEAERAGHLDADGRRAIQLTADAIAGRWDTPDAGIWELDPDWWTHSRLACVAGLREVATIAPSSGDAGRLSTLADSILARTTSTCLHPDGYWQQSPHRTGVDAALVWPAVRGALPADDPRTQATLDAVLRDLTVDGYAYRYAPDGRPLGDAEGAFLLCGFMVAEALAQQGQTNDALRWYERNRAACGSPGLFTEEYDIQQRQLRGNLPQAFVHAAALHAAVELAP